MKTKTLWLARDKDEVDGYRFAISEPERLRSDGIWEVRWGARRMSKYFCRKEFELYFPSLKIKRGYKIKLKLTVIKNGIKIEKVGLAVKGIV